MICKIVYHREHLPPKEEPNKTKCSHFFRLGKIWFLVQKQVAVKDFHGQTVNHSLW